MINSRSFRNREQRKERQAQIKPITHTQIMSRKGANRSINAPGDIKQYKGGTRVPIESTSTYKVFSFNMPGSNGSGEYKITSGNQTFIILDGVLFVNKSNKSGTENLIIRSGDYISFSKGDVVSFCPNVASMSGILVESNEIKTKKHSDPIVNASGAAVYENTRHSRRANHSPAAPRRKEKSVAQREAYGQAYLAARGISQGGGAISTNVAGQALRNQSPPPPESGEDVATMVEGESPQPMGDKDE